MSNHATRAHLFNAVWPDGIGGRDNLSLHIKALPDDIKRNFLDAFDERQLKLLGVDYEVINLIKGVC